MTNLTFLQRYVALNLGLWDLDIVERRDFMLNCLLLEPARTLEAVIIHQNHNVTEYNLQLCLRLPLIYIKVTPTYATVTTHWGGNIIKYFLISQSYFCDEIMVLAKRNHFVPNSLLPYSGIPLLAYV